MADSYITDAGSMQAIPTIDVVEHETEAFITEAGSMQSALPVNVQSGGIPEGEVAVGNGDPINVRNSQGVDAQSATIVVTDGVLVGADLGEAVALVANGVALQVPVTGVYVDTVTFTVASGSITGIALS